MQIDLIKEEAFTVQIGDEKLTMRVKSRWNGLMELRTTYGDVLIVTEPTATGFFEAFDSLFGGVFRTAEEIKDAGVQVVMGSPNLISELRKPKSADPA